MQDTPRTPEVMMGKHEGDKQPIKPWTPTEKPQPDGGPPGGGKKGGGGKGK